MLKNDKPLKRYSEAFKLKVLSELASGKYNKNEIQKVYGISTASIGDWLRKYNRLDLFNSVLKVESLEELERIKALEKAFRDAEAVPTRIVRSQGMKRAG